MSWRMRVAGESTGALPDVWRDGCAALSRNICELLRAAGAKVIRRNILCVLDGIPTGGDWPHGSACRECLECVAAEAEAGRFPKDAADALAEYFFEYLGQMRPSAKKMLEESFRGVMEGLTLDGDLPMAVEIAEP